LYIKKIGKLCKGGKWAMRKYVAKPRRPFGRAMGMDVPGAVLPIADTDDWKTLLHGACYRYARQVPEPNNVLLNECAKWQRSFLYHNVLPLSHVISFEEWLATTSYPNSHKLKLRETYDRMGGNCTPFETLVKDFVRDAVRPIKGFGKLENYLEYKPARGINPLGDEFMCLAGPFVKSIEQAIFHDDGSMNDHHISRYFVKSIPVSERSQFINDRLGDKGAWFGKSDHSSFEAHTTPKVYNKFERTLYDYMGRLCVPKEFLSYFHNVNIHKNKVNYGCGLTVWVIGRRMSGMPNTSLGNGYTNLVAGLFNAVHNGADIDTIDCICEGDDGIIACQKIGPTEKTYLDLGFEVKFERVDCAGDVGFCHIYYDENQCSVALTDPRKTLIGFGWTHGQFMGAGDAVMKQLLRAKGLSLKCEFPSCPVLGVLAYKAIQLTDGVKARMGNSWKEQQLSSVELIRAEKNALPNISAISRRYVEDHFNISVSQQLQIEAAILNTARWDCPMTIPELESLVDPMWSDFSDTYAFRARTHDDALSYA